MPKPAIILGLHYAPTAKNVTLCAARSSDEGCELLATHSGYDEQMDKVILDWIAREEATLLAIDTPLGWPADLATVLSSHQAGLPQRLRPGSLFYRECDRMLKREFDIAVKPIGADRSALTSYAALTFLDHIGYLHGMRIPLAWDQFLQFPAQCVEVSAPATLASLNLPNSKFSGKETQSLDTRNAILQGLKGELCFDKHYQQLLDDPRLLLAAINALAGHHFIHQPLIQPTDLQTSKKEGWIWVRKPAKKSQPAE